MSIAAVTGTMKTLICRTGTGPFPVVLACKHGIGVRDNLYDAACRLTGTWRSAPGTGLPHRSAGSCELLVLQRPAQYHGGKE